MNAIEHDRVACCQLFLRRLMPTPCREDADGIDQQNDAAIHCRVYSNSRHSVHRTQLFCFPILRETDILM